MLFLVGLLCAQQGARLLVIAYDQYCPQLQDFADWKTKRGMLTKVVPLSSVGSTPDEIRSYVQNAYNTWIPRPEFLLLVGYGGQVPSHYYDGGIYTDNYYADMSGDYKAELKYGRFPCRTVQQCSTMVAKTMGYERTPFLGDSLWFREGLTVVREDYDSDDTIYWDNAHLAMRYMDQNGFAGYDSLSLAMGDDNTNVQSSVTNGKSFVMYRGVGTVNWWYPFWVDPGAIYNGYMLPVVLSGTCMTVTLGPYPTDSMVGDAWLRGGTVASPQGAVAFFGNTHAASSVAAQRGAVCRGFMRAYFADSVATLGEAALAGKAQLDTEFHDSIEYQGFNLLGDPTLLYWTAKPFSVQADYDSVVPNRADTFRVTVRKAGQPLKNCVVCARKDTEVYQWGVTDAQGSVALAIAPTSPGSMDVTVTGRNVLPFEGMARVTDANAGVTAIVAPATFIPPGAIAPEVKVLNCGSSAITFPVVLRITDSAGALAYRDTQEVSGLAPRETLPVSFANWQAQNGLYLATCSTRLAYDVDPANDTLSRRVVVVTHDAGVSRIVSPAGSFDSSVVVVPSAEVRNSGSRPDTFEVFFHISSGWNDSARVSNLAAGDSATVVFDTWPKPHVSGGYTTRCSTHLAGDINPGNDTACGSFTVTGGGPPSWTQMPSLPQGGKSKNVKDGGALAFGLAAGGDDTGYVYGFKGNNTHEFYRYNTATNAWVVRDSIPAVGHSGKKKTVKKGAALVAGTDGKVYGVKGNNTLEFWCYDSVSGAWTQLTDVPPGTKTLKEGTGLAAVNISGTDYIYVLKGSGTYEFYRFKTSDGSWETMANAPAGNSNKPYKCGSCLAYDGGDTIYCLKGSYNELAAYSISGMNWVTKDTMPRKAPPGTKKTKVKDGAGMACYGRAVYALKGGNTDEFWMFSTTDQQWHVQTQLPAGSRNVKGGGALVYAGSTKSLYAFRGNNTLEFWSYGPLWAGGDLLAANREQMSEQGQAGVHSPQFALSVFPSLFTSALNPSISYSLPIAGNVNLKLYGINGRLVSTLVSGYHPAGNYAYRLSPIAHRLSAGVYLLEFETDGITTSRKLMLAR